MRPARSYDQSATIDFTNKPGDPTPIQLTLGDNEIRGTIGRAMTGGPVDRDFFTFAIPAGQQLTSISLLRGSTTARAGGLGFIGLIDGDSFGDAVPASASGLLGYTHYSVSQIGTDILDDIGAGASSRQFTAPLGPGTCAVWVQETAVSSVSYGLNFHKTHRLLWRTAKNDSKHGAFSQENAPCFMMPPARRLGCPFLRSSR